MRLKDGRIVDKQIADLYGTLTPEMQEDIEFADSFLGIVKAKKITRLYWSTIHRIVMRYRYWRRVEKETGKVTAKSSKARDEYDKIQAWVAKQSAEKNEHWRTKRNREKKEAIS